MEEVTEQPQAFDREGMIDDDGQLEGEPSAHADAEDVTERLARIIESLLFAAAAPVSLRRLVDALAGPTVKDVQKALARLLQEYAPGQRGIHLREVAGGYQFRTARENAEWVRAIFREKPARLGRATLETLAIVAYKQPVTRVDVEAIRGVDVDGVLSTLLSRRLIKIAGRKEAVGRPLLYSTTPEFLEVFGLKDLNELPSLKELGPAPDEENGEAAPTGEPRALEAPAPAAADTAPVAAESAIEAPGESQGESVGEPGGGDAAGQITTAANAAGAHATGAHATADAALAEDSQPRRDRLAQEGGGADPGGAGACERAHGDRAGDEGEPEDGPDHD